MTYTQTPFVPDYPGALVIPAHENNVIDLPNNPRGFVLHAPEEPVDDVESTPYYFARDISPRQASTHFYADSDGDIYQMVPTSIGACANGLIGKSCPTWADPNVNLNLQTENVEIEGYGAGMHRTCPRGSRQWNSVVRLVEYRSWVRGFPPTRERIIGHYQVSSQRTCPGTLDINGIVADVWKLREERLMTPDVELIKATNAFAGTFEEAAGYMLRREKMPKGLRDRLQAILNLSGYG